MNKILKLSSGHYHEHYEFTYNPQCSNLKLFKTRTIFYILIPYFEKLPSDFSLKFLDRKNPKHLFLEKNS